MRRREFITLIAGAAAAPSLLWPFAARAQQPGGMPVIGYFSGRSPETEAPIRTPFLKALETAGFAAGRNVAIEYRFAEGRVERFPVLAAELVRRQVAMLVATDRPSAVAAKAATATIPIVFTSGLDPVQIGLVASFNRPGGNATGVSLFSTVLGPKRLGLLRELLPQPGTIAFFVNPENTATPLQVTDMQAAAQAVGQPLLIFNAGTEVQVDKAFAAMAERKVAAILYGADVWFQVVTERLVALAARYRIPALYEWREFVTAGGLMSYSTDRTEFGLQAGIYAGRILKGEKPADLPVVQSAKFELVINLKTAKALGLTIPPSLLARADEVIEGAASSSRCSAARRRGRSRRARSRQSSLPSGSWARIRQRPRANGPRLLYSDCVNSAGSTVARLRLNIAGRCAPSASPR
ncbi:MAG: ABC transporter substrate-binding protein [Xanthobacteraceae bacterium]